MPLLSEVLREFPYTKDWSPSSSLYFFSPEVWASPFLGHSQITCKALRMKNFFPLAFPMSHFLNLFLLIPVLTPQPPCPPEHISNFLVFFLHYPLHFLQDYPKHVTPIEMVLMPFTGCQFWAVVCIYSERFPLQASPASAVQVPSLVPVASTLPS